jgi:BASS family bile acid:Na+ symporter
MIQIFNHFIHKNLLKILLIAYGLAIFFPQFGVAIKNLSFFRLQWTSSNEINFSLPLVMLSFLLLNAGLSVKISNLKKVLLFPGPLMIGLVSNFLIPLGFTFAFAFLGKMFWHEPDEIQNVLVGLAIIASMPIAGSSTAWAQSSGGNPALVLGLVVASTLFSPLLSPLVLKSIAYITAGDYSEDLHELANQGTSAFLTASIVVPSLIGIGLRTLMTEKHWESAGPGLKMANLLNLILLNYSNASVALPTAFSNWDADFLAMIALTTTLLCSTSFFAGWSISKLMKFKHPERVALTYALGMSNNGTGLVLASSALSDHPLVMLPIIFYNLGQQIIAGVFNSKISENSSPAEAPKNGSGSHPN